MIRKKPPPPRPVISPPTDNLQTKVEYIKEKFLTHWKKIGDYFTTKKKKKISNDDIPRRPKSDISKEELKNQKTSVSEEFETNNIKDLDLQVLDKDEDNISETEVDMLLNILQNSEEEGISLSKAFVENESANISLTSLQFLN